MLSPFLPGSEAFLPMQTLWTKPLSAAGDLYGDRSTAHGVVGGPSRWRPGCYHNMMTCSLTSRFYLPGKRNLCRIRYPTLCRDYRHEDFAQSSVKKVW